MTLNSLTFIVFFIPLVLALHSLARLAPRPVLVRKMILLVASIFFYALTSLEYLPHIALIILINYLLGRSLARGGSGRKVKLAAGIILDIGFLAVYKYLDFFRETVSMFSGIQFESIALLQPLGISFITFSLVSYLIDLYRGDIETSDSVLEFSVWALFFPKVIAGPIVRYGDMDLSSSFAQDGARFEDLSAGLRRFLMGLGKKVILADGLGKVVDAIFLAQTNGVDTPTAWLGLICFTLQIFLDFAGYSDMAIGLARMFGIRFKENFDYPYISRSLGEFWHRWHISLSTWFRDYLYFPLGGSRRGNVYVNLFIVMTVSGLWHGASWTYIAWGVWHGIFMIIDRVIRVRSTERKSPAFISWAYTMMIVLLGWVFFRSADIGQAISYLGMLVGYGTSDTQFFAVSYYMDPQLISYLIAGALLSTPIFSRMGEKFRGRRSWEILQGLAAPVLLALSLIYIVNSTYSPFLYAQF